MEEYYGVITLGTPANDPASDQTPAIVKTMFVHYPDCQQLSIWLPQSGYNYGAVRLINAQTGAVVDERPTSHRLSGEIKVLWDTLDIPPGDYTIEMDHPEGWKHCITLKKYEAGIEPPVEKSVEVPTVEEEDDSEPTVYRDGFGNLMPNEDLILREKAFKELAVKFSRRIEYEGTARAGTITYVDPERRIRFSHEMGGGNCMFYIDIPTETEWEAKTQTPLSSRAEILEFVADTVQRQQASSCRYEIGDSEIGYYYRS